MKNLGEVKRVAELWFFTVPLHAVLAYFIVERRRPEGEDAMTPSGLG